MISTITVSLKDLARFDTPFTNHCRASDKQKPKSKYVLNVIDLEGAKWSLCAAGQSRGP